ncbi:MAG: VanW family protein, partial [bacterium]
MSGRATILTGLLLALVLGIGAVAWQGPSVTTLATYATSLDGRSRSQRHNALLALQRLDGAVIAPGATFSFNDQVGSWSRDQGYVKAPVSFSGQLIPSWGGGVCQTSTTLYNVALLAGCDITERHRHHFAPTYCPPGRDAAVAYDAIDLAFRNPYPWPLTLHTESRHDRIVISMTGRHGAPPVQLETQVYELRRPATLS